MFSYDLSTYLQIISSKEFYQYKIEHPDENVTVNFDFIKKIGLDFNKLTQNMNINNIPAQVYKSKEVILNKNDTIYPNHTYEEFLNSNEAKKIIKNFKDNFNK